MKNSTAADLVEKSLPLFRLIRIGVGAAFVLGLGFSVFGELFDPDFDRTWHWLWVGATVAFLLSYMIQWSAEGEAKRYREAGDD